jgi:hypothetical protein
MIGDYNHIQYQKRIKSMADLQTFGDYLKLEDKLMKLASIEDVLETARLLAMSLAHYEFN